MTLPASPNEVTFAPEQRRVLGEIYRFLMMRRRERLAAMEKEKIMDPNKQNLLEGYNNNKEDNN